MKRLTPVAIQCRMILDKIKAIENLNPKQFLACVKEMWNDFKVILGSRVGFGLALIELMVYWQEDADSLKDFIRVHQQLLEKYRSEDKEDVDQINKWFEELEEKTGFKVTEGWMYEDTEEEIEQG